MHAHALSHLRLKHPRLLARLEQDIQQCTFLLLNPFDFLANAGTPHELGDELNLLLRTALLTACGACW